MQEGPIPYSAIVDYFDRLVLLDSDQHWAGVYMIRGMDGAYLKFRNDQADRKRKIAEANVSTNK